MEFANKRKEIREFISTAYTLSLQILLHNGKKESVQQAYFMCFLIIVFCNSFFPETFGTKQSVIVFHSISKTHCLFVIIPGNISNYSEFFQGLLSQKDHKRCRRVTIQERSGKNCHDKSMARSLSLLERISIL